MVQPAVFASPPKWHLAHTTWFFEEFILRPQRDYKVFDEKFCFLFNSYYNNAGDRIFRADRGNITRPDVSEVYAYRAYVDRQMAKLLKEELTTTVESLIVLGINHEQQHQELLLTDLKHTLANNPTFPMYQQGANLVSDKNGSTGFISVDEGVYEIGHKSDDFCYDNELGAHKVFIHDFDISESLITNGEYIDFIDDGGYNNFNLWHDPGWSWVQAHHVNSPLYWHLIDDEWHYYTLAGLKRVDAEAILSHVGFYEAFAFAEWRGMRLPTEFEWEVAADKFDWGKRWEWTYSAYLPYPNFTKAAGAIGEYNGKFMINQMVLRGASIATAEDHSRKTYRNFFHPQERWQFTGIRLAK